VFDEQGRFSPQTVPGTEQVFPCDTVLVAVGQSGDTGFVNGLPGLELGRSGTVIADRETGRTSIPWLFSAGDAALGPGLFIDAIAHGRRAARAIALFLDGARPAAESPRAFQAEAPGMRLRPDTFQLRRASPGAAPVDRRVRSLDLQVEVGFDERVARDQGSRCLRCDVETIFDGNLCIQCGGCADVCPTWCLRLVSLDEIGMAGAETAGLSAIIKDEERCLRCGACAQRCPTGAVTMERLCGFEPWVPLPGAPETAA
jgi:NADPH-dependent glutamate synthase beta subunit-like oxidoreductase